MYLLSIAQKDHQEVCLWWLTELVYIADQMEKELCTCVAPVQARFVECVEASLTLFYWGGGGGYQAPPPLFLINPKVLKQSTSPFRRIPKMYLRLV